MCPTGLHIAFSDRPHLHMITYSLLENHVPFSKWNCSGMRTFTKASPALPEYMDERTSFLCELLCQLIIKYHPPLSQIHFFVCLPFQRRQSWWSVSGTAVLKEWKLLHMTASVHAAPGCLLQADWERLPFLLLSLRQANAFPSVATKCLDGCWEFLDARFLSSVEIFCNSSKHGGSREVTLIYLSFFGK